jgi:membrane-associated phospholipid phosphatase
VTRKDIGRKITARIERADVAVVDRLAPWLRSPAIKGLGAIGNVGDQPPLLAFCAGIMLAGVARGDRKLARTGGRMTLAHLLATACKTIGKDNLDRTRPRQRLEDGDYHMGEGHSHDPALRSFPSGHTAGAVALARAAAREYPDQAAIAYGGAAAIGALQLPRQAHFPTDIAAGAIVGIVAEAVVDGALRLWWTRRLGDL